MRKRFKFLLTPQAWFPPRRGDFIQKKKLGENPSWEKHWFGCVLFLRTFWRAFSSYKHLTWFVSYLTDKLPEVFELNVRKHSASGVSELLYSGCSSGKQLLNHDHLCDLRWTSCPFVDNYVHAVPRCRVIPQASLLLPGEVWEINCTRLFEPAPSPSSLCLSALNLKKKTTPKQKKKTPNKPKT